MANELTTVLETQWSNDVKHDFQQMESRLVKHVRSVMNVGAETYKFHKLGATTTAAGPVLGSDHAGIAASHSVATVTLTDQYSNHYIDELTMKKVLNSGDMRREYVQSTGAAVRRWVDDQIITAANASNTVITTTTGGFTYAKFLEAIELAAAAEIDNDERVLVIKAKQLSEMLNISQFTNADYDSLHQVYNGGIANVLGVKVVMSNRLTSDVVATPDNDLCYLIQKSAIGIAFAQDPSTKIDWVPEKSAYFVNTNVSMGATVIDSAGVIQIPCAIS